jgi:hypothetical protein
VRRLLLALLLTLGLTPTFAADPLAHISGPTTAVVGTPVLLDVSGSATDPDYPLQVEIAGSDDLKPTLRLWYDSTAKPGLAVLTAPRPGTYTVVVVAIGKPDKADKPVTRIAAWPVEVTPIPPAPKPPEPEPGPGPNPPSPTPTPVAGKLWGSLILPDLPTPAQAALRTSADLRSAFSAKNTFFRAYLAGESEVATPGWQAAITAAGGAPVVLWMNETGKVVRTTPAPTVEKIKADLQSLRGGN